jgi:hypothetical protein
MLRSNSAPKQVKTLQLLVLEALPRRQAFCSNPLELTSCQATLLKRTKIKRHEVILRIGHYLCASAVIEKKINCRRAPYSTVYCTF